MFEQARQQVEDMKHFIGKLETLGNRTKQLEDKTAQKKCAELQNIASSSHLQAYSSLPELHFPHLPFPHTLFTRPGQNSEIGIQRAERGSNPKSKELECRTGPLIYKLSLKSENPRIMLGLSVYIGRCQSRVLQGRRALTCTGRTFHLAPAQLGREDGGRAGPGMWHLRGLAVAAPQPEQEVQLQQAEAKRDRSKAELQEAEAKLQEAEAKLEKAEAKLEKAEANLKEAKATGTEEDVGLAMYKVDSAQKGVDSAQKGVDSAQKGVDSAQNGVTSSQELVDACTKRLASLLKEPVAGWTLDTADSVYQLFKDKGWVPEQLPAPLRLVMTSKVLPKLRHREDAIRLLCETVSKRFENYLQGLLDKEKQPHLSCFATAGTGKSRLAQDALSLLQKHVENRELCALLQNSTVSVHVTFNGGTKCDRWDRENGAQAALSARVLASYFGVEIESLRFLRRIELRAALDCILLDFRRRRSLAQDSPVAFYLAIDDAGQTLLDVENAQAARSFLKDISNAAGSWLLRPPRSVFPITLITGTTAQAIASILSTESSHPYEDWANDGQVQQLLADIGGLPRLLEILSSSLQELVKRGQRPTNASRATVQHELMTFIEQRTGHLNEEVVHAIVRAELTREIVTNEDVAH
eukprot:g35408.t1